MNEQKKTQASERERMSAKMIALNYEWKQN